MKRNHAIEIVTFISTFLSKEFDYRAQRINNYYFIEIDRESGGRPCFTMNACSIGVEGGGKKRVLISPKSKGR